MKGSAILFSLWWLWAIHPIIGIASVIDGDTIEIQGQSIRFLGIDAPESSQWCRDASGQKVRCGQQAALLLDSHRVSTVSARGRILIAMAGRSPPAR